MTAGGFRVALIGVVLAGTCSAAPALQLADDAGRPTHRPAPSSLASGPTGQGNDAIGFPEP